MANPIAPVARQRFCVAPWGRDSWPGTAEEPFATIARAQQAVRAATAGMSEDVVVDLCAGTYVLPAPLEMQSSSGDSGQHGHAVIYQSRGWGTPAQEEVVLSGGRVISGWRHEDNGPRWRAHVGDLDTRQLFVDGQRARRAILDGGLPGEWTRTATGYLTTSTAPQSWASPADIEFVYRGVYPWSEPRIGVATIEGDERSTTITLDQPAFDWAVALYDPVGAAGAGGTQGGIGAPSAVEGSPSFVTERGTFALDRSRPGGHVLWYLPREGENLDRAQVVAPALEVLLRASGTDGDPLHDVSFRGITFADTTWLGPDAPEGFLHYWAGTFYAGGPRTVVRYGDGPDEQVTVPAGDARVLPGAVILTATQRIALEGCRFTRLGADALVLSAGTRQALIKGNEFSGVCGGAVTIGASDGDSWTSTGNRVENNWIHHIGREYSGSPAIALTGTQDSVVAHNLIEHVPYSGIVIGGGDTARGAHIVANLIRHTMEVLADGGGIYLAGSQGASYASGATVRGNIVRDTITPYNFGLYADYGAAWITFQGNVVHRAHATAVLHVAPPLQHVCFLGNVWDAEPLGADAVPDTVVIAANVLLPQADFDRSLAADPTGADVLATAGLQLRL